MSPLLDTPESIASPAEIHQVSPKGNMAGQTLRDLGSPLPGPQFADDHPASAPSDSEMTLSPPKLSVIVTVGNNIDVDEPRISNEPVDEPGNRILDYSPPPVLLGTKIGTSSSSGALPKPPMPPSIPPSPSDSPPPRLQQ